jgi:DNA-binding CsgD family transcriptional regulator
VVYGARIDLTAREQQIFRLIAEGLHPSQVAAHLELTQTTVNGVMLRVRRKLGAQTTAHAVFIAERYYRHVLKGAIAQHGNRGARASHLRYGTPLCEACSMLDAEHRKPMAMVSSHPADSEVARLRPSDPAECGTMPAVRRHQRNGDRMRDLTCGCREALAAWWREYRRLNGEASEAA